MKKMTKKILVVDDKRYMVDVLRIIRENEGYEIVCGYSGKECMEKLEGEKPDLILLDLMVPEMNGWETVDCIRSNESTKDTPVVMITVKERIPSEEELRVKGIRGYITKPFEREDLIKRLKKILEAPSS